MTGDIADQLPLPETAGIVPRVLSALFTQLDSVSGSPNPRPKPEYDVKVTYLELYNEELRDLLSSDRDKKDLTIVEGDSKKGQAATIVRGNEEIHIHSASDGLELLRKGTKKRQVASTKCNDLSSRSHTIFTINVFAKRPGGDEKTLHAGKLNLVDLAGSESIGRSGAEAKRAVE